MECITFFNKRVDVFERGTQNPTKTVKEAIEYANKFALDTVIVDTAGRLQIDEVLMKELQDIKDNINPRKWICVGVEEDNVIVDNIGDLVILIMDNNYPDTLHENFKNLK